MVNRIFSFGIVPILYKIQKIIIIFRIVTKIGDGRDKISFRRDINHLRIDFLFYREKENLFVIIMFRFLFNWIWDRYRFGFIPIISICQVIAGIIDHGILIKIRTG